MVKLKARLCLDRRINELYVDVTSHCSTCHGTKTQRHKNTADVVCLVHVFLIYAAGSLKPESSY